MAKKRGYVYVLEDKNTYSQYKIGKTTNLAQRERDLQGAGPHDSFKIVESVQVDDMDAVEQAFHAILKRHLVPSERGKREWFNFTLDEVRPMLRCLENLGAARPKPNRQGEWHEDGWKMHCDGVTEIAIAQEFRVTRGAVAAMKRKMRSLGRGHEERNRGSKAGARKERVQGGTPLSSFRQPIIEVLQRFGGRARAKDVLLGIEKLMSLGPADLKKLKTGHVVWRKRASWAAHQLKIEGELKPDSQWGWWELP